MILDLPQNNTKWDWAHVASGEDWSGQIDELMFVGAGDRYAEVRYTSLFMFVYVWNSPQ